MTKVVILGGGFAGCAAAHMIRKKHKDWDIILLELTDKLGAGNRTQFYGGHPHTFGPRHFLTPWNYTYEYLDELLPLRKLDHSFYTYVERDSNFYSFPMSYEDIDTMPDKDIIYEELKQGTNIKDPSNLEDYWLKKAGKTLYEKFAKYYNQKMWLVDSNKELDAGYDDWSTKGELIYEKKGQNFHDMISAYPKDPLGYDKYFDIATRDIKILYKKKVSRVDFEKKNVYCSDNSNYDYDVLINTISVDILDQMCFGELRYVGVDFIPIVLPIKQCLPGNTFFLYYSGKEVHKRIVEYKKFTLHESEHTLIGLEIPSMNGKHYTMPILSEISLYKKYIDNQGDDVFNIGRAGSYEYIDIDDCIDQAMKVASKI